MKFLNNFATILILIPYIWGAIQTVYFIFFDNGHDPWRVEISAIWIVITVIALIIIGLVSIMSLIF